MPCSDNGDYEDRRTVRAALNYATRVACELGAVIVLNNLWDSLSEDAKSWLEVHEELDRKRRDG